ncbi:hypothetical protein E2562_022665 [Oryza meyeriana var. granulata]|uniref:Uncharacterized protein n=1 Tax=Oryza meyeriana var. granulata TaxID=110450 RepID=A0A6G1E106_9ORYZ|nr:hypothetical protein E2562_022665 [Oryza meyeriana var. granulata]
MEHQPVRPRSRHMMTPRQLVSLWARVPQSERPSRKQLAAPPPVRAGVSRAVVVELAGTR